MSETSTTGVYLYQQICKTTAEWTADNSVIPENKWLFERCTDGRIITKLSNGLLPYSKLYEYGLSAWDAAQLGGYEGTKAEFYSALEFIDEKTKIIIDLVASMNGKSAEAPTLKAKPTETTLSYKSGEIICNFTIGQQCRVYDTENKKYVFYKLYDITIANKADWRITSSSGNSNSPSLETVKTTLLSNQGIADTSLYGSIVSVVYAGQQNDLTWNGIELSTTIPEQVKYQVVFPDVEGYLSPDVQEYTSIAGENRAIIVTYSTEKLTVNVSTSDSISTTERTTTLTNVATSEVIASQKGASAEFKIPFGVNYKVSVDNFTGYVCPDSKAFTASTVARNLSVIYEKARTSRVVQDDSLSDPANITGDVNGIIIQQIRTKIRRCLAKKSAEGQMMIRYLKDDNSNYYDDGSAAKLDGTEGDVMVYFPRFYYKYENLGSYKFAYSFAFVQLDGTWKESAESLVGAYEAYSIDSKVYSRSGVASTGAISQANFKAYARSRGTGYQIIDYDQHKMIAWLFYAIYGTRHCQSVCGRGTGNFTKDSGQTNTIGNADTTTVNGNTMSVNFLGIENCWGNKYELLDNIIVTKGTWVITNTITGVSRSVVGFQASGNWEYAKTVVAGEDLDIIAKEVGMSDSTGYSDGFSVSINGPYVVVRSGYSSFPTDGVVCLVASNNSSSTSLTFGSRLAFRGVISEAESVSMFKASNVIN